MKRRDLLRAAACVAAPFVWSGGAGAQGALTGPIRVLVGFAPGGTSDVTARIVGEALSAVVGQPVLVENRPGAQGGIATEAVVRAKPDGTTLLVSPPEPLWLPFVETSGFPDLEKSLAPITVLSSQPIIVAVNPATGWTSIAELIAAAKAQPAGLSYATPGPGGTNNIIAALLFRKAGIKVENIPYKGGGQAVQDLLSGVVPVAILGSAPLMPHVKTGRVTLLAVTSKQRSAMLPSVPSLAELGYPDIDMSQWFAAFAPAATPPDIVQRLSAAFLDVLADPQVKAKLALAALETVGGTPQEFSQRLKNEGEVWLRTARQYGIGRN